LGDERLVSRGLARDADHVDVVLDRLTGGLLRRLEEGSDIDVEADAGERGRGHPRAATVAVVAELHPEHARTAAFGLGEGLDLATDPLEAFVARVSAAIDARHRADDGAMAREDFLERVRDLADGGAGARRLDRELEEISLSGSGGVGQRGER